MALKMIVPPCQAACPILTDVQGYVSLAARGKLAESLEVARATNPFASVCGYICFHPCEGECRRAAVDQAVSIMALKRAAADYGRSQDLSIKSGEKSANGQKVAVVGAGPAGLTAALDLTRLGYEVEVFDREAEAGGMLSLAIPAYRLPLGAVEADIKAIQDAGVKIMYGQELGRNLSLNDLRKKGFSAIIVATGLPLSRSLPVFPDDNRRVLLAIPFLKVVRRGDFPEIGKRVIVVGGGNVAIDVARSALRIGAEEVELVCLESREEMPAHEWEIPEAVEEGVQLHCCWGPKEVLAATDEVEGLRCKAVKSTFDAEGRFNPTYFEEKLTEVSGDTIIVAIGQMSEPANTEVQAAREGKVDGVFVAGEVKEGPGSAVEAMRSGHNTAAAVHLYLSGSPRRVGASRGRAGEEVSKDEATVVQVLPDDVKAKLKRLERVKRDVRPPEERRCDFKIFEAGFGREEASKEALRCLSCAAGAVVNEDLCVACLTCVRCCPYKVPTIGENNVAEIDPDKCQACGICVTECPALAIQFRRGQEEELLSEMEEALASSKNIEFYCQRRLFFGQGEGPEAGWARVRVLCAAHVSTMSILKAFELGAEKVIVSTCEDEDCFWVDGHKWARERLAKAKDILHEVGADEEAISLRGKA